MKEKKQDLNELANKMGLRILEANYITNKDSHRAVAFSKTLNISKPNRQEVKEKLQRQLETIK